MATIKADRTGRNWLAIGPIAPPRTFGPEFGYEERYTPPAAERFYSAAESYADTIDMKNVWGRMVWREIERNAVRLYADLTARGCSVRVDGETLWVSDPHKLSAQDIEDIEFQKT